MDIKKIYEEAGALLSGHFLLSSGNHSPNYLQSAKVLEDPKKAELLAKELANMIQQAGIKVDKVCAPALGGVIAGYELARALGVHSIFVERKDGVMQLRRGFEVKSGENIIICEDIITTGGSALEAAKIMQEFGACVVAFAALANRGFCKRFQSNNKSQENCKLPDDIPLFALADFDFPIYSPNECPLCKEGIALVKPGSRGNN